MALENVTKDFLSIRLLDFDCNGLPLIAKGKIKFLGNPMRYGEVMLMTAACSYCVFEQGVKVRHHLSLVHGGVCNAQYKLYSLNQADKW